MRIFFMFDFYNRYPVLNSVLLCCVTFAWLCYCMKYFPITLIESPTIHHSNAEPKESEVLVQTFSWTKLWITASCVGCIQYPYPHTATIAIESCNEKRKLLRPFQNLTSHAVPRARLNIAMDKFQILAQAIYIQHVQRITKKNKSLKLHPAACLSV